MIVVQPSQNIESISNVRSFLDKCRLAIATLFLIVLALFIYFWYAFGIGDWIQIIGMIWLGLDILHKFSLALYNLCRYPKCLMMPNSPIVLYILGCWCFVANALSLKDHVEMRLLMMLTFDIDIMLWIGYILYWNERIKELEKFNQKEAVEVIKIEVKN